MSSVFLRSDDGTYSPYEENVLRQMVGRGQVAAATLYWREGMAEWRPVGEFIEGTASLQKPASMRRPVSAQQRAHSPLALARATQVMLILCLLVTVLMIYGGAGQMLFVYQPRIDLQAAREHDLLMKYFTLFSLVIYLSTSVPFLMWVYLVADNARKLAGALSHRAGYTVASFFIPGVNLVHPCVAMQETWKASGNPRNWRGERNSLLVGFWWAFWLLTAFLFWSLFWLPKVEDRDSLQLTTTFLLVLEVVSLILCGLAFAVVQAVTSRQMRQLRLVPPPATDPARSP